MQQHSFFRNLPPLSLRCWCKPTLLECLRGCQHPSNKFEILWQVAQNLFSLLLSYFVAQYVLVIVVWFFLWKYILAFEKWLFLFNCSNMQIFTVNITQVVWLHVTNILDLRYFCEHNPLFYHLNLIPCHYWSWQRNIYFLVNIFVQHIFPMSKSSIKTKTVLTMTNMTESTELQAFKRPKDGYCKNFLVYLCCSILRWTQSPAKFTW